MNSPRHRALQHDYNSTIAYFVTGRNEQPEKLGIATKYSSSRTFLVSVEMKARETEYCNIHVTLPITIISAGRNEMTKGL